MNVFTFGKGKQTELKNQIKGNSVNSTSNIEYIEQVEKCQQIIRDDKNILRQLIKEGNNQVIAIIKSKKKQIDQMQTELKKFLKSYKNQQPYNEGQEQVLGQKQQNPNDSFNSQIITDRQLSRNSTHQNIHQNNLNQNKVQQNGINQTNSNQQRAYEGQINQQQQHQQQVFTTSQTQSNKVNLITYKLHAPATPINQVSLVSKEQNSPLDKKPRSQSQQDIYSENKLSIKPQIQSQGISTTTDNINSARVQKNNYFFKNDDQNIKQQTSQTSRNDYSQQTVSPKDINQSQKLKKVPSIPKYNNNNYNQADKLKKSPKINQRSSINKQNQQFTKRGSKKNIQDQSKDTSRDNSQILSQDKLQTPKNLVKQAQNKKENENLAFTKVNAKDNVLSFDLQTASQPQYQTPRQNIASPQQFQVKLYGENQNKAFGVATQDQSERKFSISSSLSNTDRQQTSNKNNENYFNQLTQNKNYSVNLVKLEQLTNNQNNYRQNNNYLIQDQKDEEVKKTNKPQEYTIKTESMAYPFNPYLQEINSNSDGYTLNRIETIYLNSEHNQKNNSKQNYDYQQYDQLDEIKQVSVQKLSSQQSNENQYSKQNFVDQNFNLDTVESNNYNPNKNNFDKYSISNQSSQNYQIPNQDNRQYQEKMFTFESPTKFTSQKDSANKKQSTDGNVVFQDEQFGIQETPTKIILPNRSISVSGQKSDNFNIIQNSYFPQNQFTDTKSIDLMSKQNSNQKYQSPFENKYINHLHDGGVSPVIPSNKSGNQTNLIGQAYSYNGSEVKQGRSQSQKDSYGVCYDFLLKDPIQSSQKFENSLINPYLLQNSNQYDLKTDPIYHLNNSNQNTATKPLQGSPYNTRINQNDYQTNLNSNKISEPSEFSIQQNNAVKPYLQQQKQTEQIESSILLANINDRISNLITPKSSTQNQQFSFTNQFSNQNSTNSYALGSMQNSIQPSSTTSNTSIFIDINNIGNLSLTQASKTPINNSYQSGTSNVYGINQPPTYTFDQQKQKYIDSQSIGSYSYRDSLSQPITQRESTLTPSYQIQNHINNAANNCQSARQYNNSLLTDWSVLNSKIENENKKLSYQYDINMRINTLKPFQFTSDNQNSTYSQSDNQYSQSFSNTQQNHDQKDQKQFNSFTQQPFSNPYQIPEISTSLTPTSSYQQQNNTSSNKIQFNSGIQEILDRYIPKSTPALSNQQSSQTNYLQPSINAYSSSFTFVDPQTQIQFDEDKIKKQKMNEDYSINNNTNIDKATSNYNKNQVDELVSKYISSQSNQNSKNISQRQSDNYMDNLKDSKYIYQSNIYQIDNQQNTNYGEADRYQNDQKGYLFIQNQQEQTPNHQDLDSDDESLKENEQNGRFYSFQDNDGNNSLCNQLVKQIDQQQFQQNNNSDQSKVHTNINQYQNNNQNLTFKALTNAYEFDSVTDFEKFNRKSNDESDQYTPVNAQKKKASEKISVVNVASILSQQSIDLQPYFYSFHSNQMLEAPAYIPLSQEDCSVNEDKFSQQVLTPRKLFHLPTLKHHLSKFTCEQVLEQIFDNFSLSLQSLTKEYFTYKMQTLVKQYVPQIQSIIILNKEINALFELSDMNKDWYLDINELGYTLSQLCKPSEEDTSIKQLYKKIDTQNKGKITQSEFLNFANSKGYDLISFTNNLMQGKKDMSHISIFY